MYWYFFINLQNFESAPRDYMYPWVPGINIDIIVYGINHSNSLALDHVAVTFT